VRRGFAGREAGVADMRILKLTLTYDGTGFAGWQRQDGLRTVQQEIEAALGEIEGGPVAVAAAGRTDAGVHALGQVATACVTGIHDPETYRRALNAKLPADVRVLAVEEAPDGFHARFAPSTKAYRYTIWNSRLPPLLARQMVWHVSFALDVPAMREAAALVVGTHDFGAFRARGSTVRTSTRTIVGSAIHETAVSPGWPLDPDPDPARPVRLITYDVYGRGFLRQMVRTLAGTLVEIGKGRRRADDMRRLLSGGVRGEAGETAPAAGLALRSVRYDLPGLDC